MGRNVCAVLIFFTAVLGVLAPKRLAPALPGLTRILGTLGERDIDDVTALLPAGMSAATIDRRLAPECSKHVRRGRLHTNPAPC
ncbi:hypothetical protein [Rhodococcus artemisiae]|uniref:Uncharacterized protein n=1 Tax=Rhodococcus artemisiae TaxID=714159 RepID=A0ABU7LEV9_9NOCA|nr:hypothetical protein [Rhodococcus artemisiae]MEE2060099.1 hypothetical protein [Rhodococcus artemisiae]